MLLLIAIVPDAFIRGVHSHGNCYVWLRTRVQPDHLRERVAPLDVQPAFTLVGILLYDAQLAALGVSVANESPRALHRRSWPNWLI
jgi:hypothetical protein